MAKLLLEVKNLKKFFAIKKGLSGKVVGHVKAVNDVSFTVEEGETVGLVGESGCGKSTTGNCILRLLNCDGGEVLWYGNPDGQPVDLAKLKEKQYKPYRKQIQMIFQDPFSSLDPRMTTVEIISEPLKAFTKMKKSERKEKVKELMKTVGLRPEYLERYPHAFSGGQRQRIGIARALALNPKFIVCDESLSSLDVSVQAQILALLKKLRDELDISYLFIAHDLSVVKNICDKVVVMYVGKVMETATTEELYSQPLHPYTEALLRAVPKTTTGKMLRRDTLDGEVPDPSHPPTGCFFNTRCEYCTERCKTETPEMIEVKTETGSRWVSCFRYNELSLKGISDIHATKEASPSEQTEELAVAKDETKAKATRKTGKTTASKAGTRKTATKEEQPVKKTKTSASASKTGTGAKTTKKATETKPTTSKTSAKKTATKKTQPVKTGKKTPVREAKTTAKSTKKTTDSKTSAVKTTKSTASKTTKPKTSSTRSKA